MDSAFKNENYKTSSSHIFSHAIKIKFKQGKWSEVNALYEESLKALVDEKLSPDVLLHVIEAKLELDELSQEFNLYKEFISNPSQFLKFNLETETCNWDEMISVASKMITQLKDYRTLGWILRSGYPAQVLYNQGYHYYPILAQLAVEQWDEENWEEAERLMDIALQDKNYKLSDRTLTKMIKNKFDQQKWSDVVDLYSRLEAPHALSQKRLLNVAHAKQSIGDLQGAASLYEEARQKENI